MTDKPRYIVTNTGVITLFYEKQVHVIDPTHRNYKAISDSLKNGEYSGLASLLDFAKKIGKKLKLEGTSLTISNGQIMQNGKQVHNTAAAKVIEFYEKNLAFMPIAKFLERTLLNESPNSREQLWRFVERWNLPITSDGFLLTHKRVADNYKDHHSGTFDNSVGKIVEMPRHLVEDNPDVGCASGLHVANLDYAKNHYCVGNGRLVVCKVDPKDVVSVPRECDEAKMRVCRYEVVDECADELRQEDYVAASPPVSEDEDEVDDDEEDEVFDDEFEEDDWDDEDDEEDEICDGCGEYVHYCRCDEYEEDEDDE